MTEQTAKESTQTSDVSETVDNTSGCVKWFNNKAGYGFITVTSGDHEDADVFVHHSAISVDQEQYRYLVQGEYVTFSLCHVDDAKHQWQAGSVRGINSGKLMCETRLESRQTRLSTREGEPSTTNTNTNNNTNTHHTKSHHNHSRDDNSVPQQYHVKTRGSGPRDGDEWMLVRTRRNNGRPQQEILKQRPPRNHTVSKSQSNNSQREGNSYSDLNTE